MLRHFSEECCQQRAKFVNGNLPSHWKNNAMAATKHANCARDHRPEPMDLRPVAGGGGGFGGFDRTPLENVH